ISTMVAAHRTASWLDRVAVTPSFSASSLTRSSRRPVTMISSWPRPPDRISPEISASPIRPPPRKATFRSFPLVGPPFAGIRRSPPSSKRVRSEEPDVGRPLGQPSRQVGIPPGAIRDIHADRFSFPNQLGLQVSPDAVEHLELVARLGDVSCLHEALGTLHQRRVVRGEVDRRSRAQERGRQAREVASDLRPALQRHLGRLEIRALCHPYDRGGAGDPAYVRGGSVQVRLNAHPDVRVPAPKLQVETEGPI